MPRRYQVHLLSAAKDEWTSVRGIDCWVGTKGNISERVCVENGRRVRENTRIIFTCNEYTAGEEALARSGDRRYHRVDLHVASREKLANNSSSSWTCTTEYSARDGVAV